MSFPGSDFELESVRQLSVAALRVKFTQDPKALDAHALNDALNPDNYTLVGPNNNYVVGAATVDGDPQSIDVYLAAPLAIGIWSLHVANIVEDTLASLIAPTTLPFTVTFTLTVDPLGHGAQNDETANIVRKFLNPALRGKGWDSMIAALAAGDQRNWDNARLAFDQLFLSSASGAYLDRRASDEGINRPPGVNMADPLFRQLAIIEKTTKLTQDAILEVLEVFYGRDTTRASSTTTAPETYALEDGDDLVVLLDERKAVTIEFVRSHFSRIGVATAMEVAAEITRELRDAGTQAFAVAMNDPILNQQVVRIYSGSLGLTSSVRIVGGKANTQLLFPTSIFPFSGTSPIAGWTVTLSPATQGNLRFTMSSGTYYDLFQVQEGDLAYLYGDEFAACGCRGTFPIEAVSVTWSGITKVQWFEIQNPLGNGAGPISQTKFVDLMFFRPTRKTIYDNSRHVIVAEAGDHLDVVMPATTEVVGRGPGLAAYLNGQPPIQVSSLTRALDGTVTITTVAPHNLIAGQQVIVDGALPSGAIPSTTAGTPSGNFPGANSTASGTTDASIQSMSSQTGSYEGVWQKVLRLQDGRLALVGGQTQTDAVTFTAKTMFTAFEKVSSSIIGNGGEQVSYLWTQISNDGTHGFSGPHFGQRSFVACVLKDGRILAAGGANNDDTLGTPSNGWDLLTFFPPTTIFQQNGTLPAARSSAGIVALAQGDAILSGGWTVVGTMLATTLRFAVSTETWSVVAPMNYARMHHELVSVGVDKVLAVGGKTATATLEKCEVYDPIGDTWTKTGSMSFARVNFGVVTLPDGRVMVFGGRGYNPTQSTTPVVLDSCEIYDFSSGLWSIGPRMRAAREYPVAQYVAARNSVYVGGGNVGPVDVLHLDTMKWTRSRATVSTTHTVTAGGLASDDTFLVAGGLLAVATEKKNYVVVPGADVFWLGAGLNQPLKVLTVPLGTSFTVKDTQFDFTGTYTVSAAGVTVTPSRAGAAPTGVPGPFSYDPKGGFAITASAATTDQTFNKGGHYSSIHLDTGIDPTPALKFPDREGFIVLNFGFKNVVGPIRYLGRLSEEELVLDASVPFGASLNVGATVRLLSSRSPFEPAPDQLVGNFYVTGTAAGRVAAQNTIDDIVAAGTQVLVTIVYPGDRGLGAEGFPQSGNYKLSDKVEVWGGDSLDREIPAARKGP